MTGVGYGICTYETVTGSEGEAHKNEDRAFLDKYKGFLKTGASISFKTDNDDLFDFSLKEFEESGFELSGLTRDLHNSEYDKDNIRTEFEQHFADQGINIKKVIAKLK